jgi:hypothetical protein
VTAKLSTLAAADYHECVRVAVEGFLHVYGRPDAAEVSAASTEPAGA